MSKFMTGALIGLAVGLLIAPEKGEETRHQLADTADKWKHRLNKLLGRAHGKLDSLRSMLGKEIDGLSEDVRNRLLAIIDEEENNATSRNGSYDFKEEFRPI